MVIDLSKEMMITQKARSMSLKYVRTQTSGVVSRGKALSSTGPME